MSTSANVIEYTIYKDGKSVGRFSKNVLCKYPDCAELLKYQPLNEHQILCWGYDEEEELWEEDVENLESYLKKMIHYNKYIKEYFNGTKTSGEILNELDELEKNCWRKIKTFK